LRAASISKGMFDFFMCHSFGCFDNSEMTQNFEHYPLTTTQTAHSETGYDFQVRHSGPEPAPS